MYVNEICKTIIGESINAGLPATIVRLCGCNLNCSFCDTMQARLSNPERI
jgi:7-carboxy-7-deazaguanine synthase